MEFFIRGRAKQALGRAIIKRNWGLKNPRQLSKNTHFPERKLYKWDEHLILERFCYTQGGRGRARVEPIKYVSASVLGRNDVYSQMENVLEVLPTEFK